MGPERKHPGDPLLGRTSLASRLQRAYREFLKLPTYLMAGLLVLSILFSVLDRSEAAWLSAGREWIRGVLFGGGVHVMDFLGLLTSGLIGMTTITFSMLLLALQQSATVVGVQVVNSFLLRRRNQLLLGFILGTTVAVLVMRAAAVPERTGLAVAFALVLTLLALYGLAVLLYAAVNQTRPQAVLEEVRTLTLEARRHQERLLRGSYREPRYEGGVESIVWNAKHGYVREIRFDDLVALLEGSDGKVEVEFRIEVGDYVAYGEEVARVRAERREESERLAAATRDIVVLDSQRATARDPSFGVEQLQMAGWSSGSSAFQNPGVAMEAVRNLRDVIARWAVDFEQEEASGSRLPIVYPDGLVIRAIDAVESVGVASTESLQAPTLEEVFRAYRNLLPDLPESLRDRVEGSIRRLLTGVADHVLTRPLESEMKKLARALREVGSVATAEGLEDALEGLREVSGQVAARSNRAQLASSDG